MWAVLTIATVANLKLMSCNQIYSAIETMLVEAQDGGDCEDCYDSARWRGIRLYACVDREPIGKLKLACEEIKKRCSIK